MKKEKDILFSTFGVWGVACNNALSISGILFSAPWDACYQKSRFQIIVGEHGSLLSDRLRFVPSLWFWCSNTNQHWRHWWISSFFSIFVEMEPKMWGEVHVLKGVSLTLYYQGQSWSRTFVFRMPWVLKVEKKHWDSIENFKTMKPGCIKAPVHMCSGPPHHLPTSVSQSLPYLWKRLLLALCPWQPRHSPTYQSAKKSSLILRS